MKCEGSHIVRFILNDKGFVEIKGCPCKWDTNLRIISLNDILESKDILSLLKSDYNTTNVNFVGDGISSAQLCNFCIDKFNADKSNFESSKEEFCSYLNIENLGIAGFTKFINTNKIGENILPLYLKKPQAQIQLEAKLKGNI